ncbi:beta-galactosidase [Paenibacillus silvisoli]|uniref:beta-galactosidase n=1 Tax=Paenibacillus silvisoli TaxID=3110539 RepID=UPI0028039D87|nr:beta-galactosidase [Paenibacillus silvisoli]
MKKQYDIEYAAEIGGAYPDRLKTFAGGGAKLKLFFVPSVKHGREIVELIRRTGVAYETVTIDRAWDLNKWGIGDFYDIRAYVDDQHIMYDNLEKVLTSDQHFDVLVIPGLNGWAHFTAAAREAIRRRVEAGAGLVLMRPFHGEDKPKSPELEALSPLVNLFEEGFAVDNNAGEGYPRVRFDLLRSDRWVAGKPHYITKGIPFELLPCEELAYYPYRAAEGAEVLLETPDGAPIAAVREYGRGRVVAFGYYPRDILPQHKDFTGKESTYDAVIDKWQGVRSGSTFAFLESFYELAFRGVAWAAKREPECALEEPERGGQAWRIRTSGATPPDEIRYRIKNAYDDVVDEGICEDGMLRLAEATAFGGDFRIELDACAGGKLLDFATHSLSLPLAASISDASVSREAVSCGETVDVDFKLQGSGPGTLAVQVIDDFGQVLQRSEHAFDSGETALSASYRAASSKSMHITVHADVKVNAQRIQRWSSAPIVVTPERRRIDDFEVFTAPQNRGHGDFLGLVGELYRELGITGLFPGSAKTLTMSGAGGLGIYWYHRAPYVERKENYYRTKDKRFLVRVPCLNDPSLWEEMRQNITSKVSAFKKFGPIAYFANDEGSLTCYSDELDLCFCPHCMRDMQAWLKLEYADLQALNRSWDTAFADWNDVQPYTREEARRTTRYAPWADHRRFMEDTFIEAYRRIAEIVRRVDEGGVIRMSGCQASTAYSGYDYYRLHQHIGYFEAYGVGNQYEFHRSFAKSGTIIGGWFGYGVDGVTARHSVWHAVYHGLTLCNLFWEFSLLNPDYTFSASARDFSVPFKEIRESGIGKLLLHVAQRDHCGIAIHYSMASVRGTNIAGDKTRFEKNRQGWIDMLEDSGCQYVFLATQQIEAGELLDQGFKLLVLPYSIALSSRETEAITRFVQEGGVVIGDFQTGLMDRHCTMLEQGQLDSLFGIERLSTEAEPFYINNEFVPNAEFPYFKLEEAPQHVRFAEFGIRSEKGYPAYRDDFMRKVSAVHVREFGAGKAVYLNLALSEYSEQRRGRAEEGDSLRWLLRRLIGLSEARKPAELTRAADGTAAHAGFESVYYRNGDAAYAAVIRGMNGDRSLGHDGLAVGAGKKDQEQSERMRFTFASAAHVYDIREGRYVGFTDTAEFGLAEGDTKLFALLPCRVSGIRLSATSSDWKRGEEASVSISLETDADPNQQFANVISFHLTDPDGNRQWLYDENLHLEGAAAHNHKLEIPFSERPGNWTVTARDAATGVTAAIKVTIG